MLKEPFLHSMRHAHAMALHAGLVDDSPQMDSAILAGVAKDIEHHRALSALTSAQARPTPENAQMHQDTAEAAAELHARPSSTSPHINRRRVRRRHSRDRREGTCPCQHQFPVTARRSPATDRKTEP
ncbi:MAG: hypothetical protein WBF73_14750, partial [Bradyrhizobium sp.]